MKTPLFVAFFSRPRTPLQIAALVSLWIATVGNVALWVEIFRHLDGFTGWRGLALGVCFATFIAAAQFILLTLFAWASVVRWASMVFLVATAAAAHFMLSYRVVIDTSMITNVLQTDPREVRDLLNWRMVATLLVIAGLPIAWLALQPIKTVNLRRQSLLNLGASALGVVVMVLALWPVFQDFASLMRNHKHVRYLINPLNTVVAMVDIGVGRTERDNKQHPIGVNAKLGPRWSGAPKPPLLLLVVGETARADHFSINGYGRDTNPELAKLANEITSFKEVRSCGTNTAVSLPCMFSHLGRVAWNNREREHESLLHVLHRAGFAVLWVDNQSGCKGVCNGLPTVQTSDLNLPPHCNSGECLDTVMLAVLDSELAKLDPARRAKGTVVVMHQMGSHGPAYFKRVPDEFRHFKPECLTSNLQQCGREQVVNSYDNTIRYTDHLLASAVNWLKNQSATSAPAMLYVSDHGESLGENNLYLHGLPYAVAPDTQKHVPMITWWSTAFSDQLQLKRDCVSAKSKDTLTHDHYFHTVMGLMDTTATEYQPALDAFLSCR